MKITIQLHGERYSVETPHDDHTASEIMDYVDRLCLAVDLEEEVCCDPEAGVFCANGAACEFRADEDEDEPHGQLTAEAMARVIRDHFNGNSAI